MKAFLILGLLTLSTQAFSSLVSIDDVKNKCTLYKRVDNDSNNVAKPLNKGEKFVTKKGVYGLILRNLEVDFDQRLAHVDVVISIVGFNENLSKNRFTIEESNPNFKDITNYLNKTVSTISEMCVGSENRIIYVKGYELK
ncbi:MAG: hypothetical protein K2Q18_03885 [Bdellovibrionales bacterium]|nr:hypothetical protein [Bdellovibrionales bacterium]